MVLGESKVDGLQRQGEDSLMHATRASFRCIGEVPALLVMLLHDSGKLPPIPNEPRGGLLGFRKPELADMEAVQWLAQWEGPRVDKDGFRRVAGLATYRDYYQMHDSSDVRELLAIRGSRRAVVELTRWLRDDAEAHERRLVGVIERHDLGLCQVMARLGGAPVSRDPWEYRP
jgi:hypothetical protein